jgi:endonuclease IV
VVPVIDWSHIYARNDGVAPYSTHDFEEIMEKFRSRLGYMPVHFHGGGIEYRNGNEVRHISARVSSPPMPYLLAALKQSGCQDFTFIVESPNSIEDANWLRGVWQYPSAFYGEIPPRRRELPLCVSQA